MSPDWGILAWAAALAALALLVVFVGVADEIERLNRVPGTIRWSTPLPGAKPGWSFNDSWVANITVVATALVALLGSTDSLKLLLGTQPTTELRLVTLASAVAVVIVAIAPLILKVVGPDLEVATVAGTLLAGAMVLAATLFEVATITIQATRLSDDKWVQFGTLGGGFLVGLLVGVYAGRSLRALVRPFGPRRAALL